MHFKLRGQDRMFAGFINNVRVRVRNACRTEIPSVGGSRFVRRLIAGEQAAAVAEYALVIGLIAASVIVGAIVLGNSARRVTSDLASGHGGGKEPSAASSEFSLEHSAASMAAVSLPATETDSLRQRIPWVTFLIAVGTLLAYSSYKMGKRRSAADDPEVVREPPTETEELDVQARIFAKRQSLLRALASDTQLLSEKQIAVRHVMTQDVLAVSPRTRVEELRAMMAEHRIHHLLVCEKGDQLVGVVSDRDLHARSGRTARELMTPDPYSVAPDAPLGPAITYLINRGISCLPVVSDGRLCGVLTTTDITLTMQCVLQLWLRLGQEANDSPALIEELSRIAKVVERDLNQQQMRLHDLAHSLKPLKICSHDKPCAHIPAQLGEILVAAKRLTGLFAHTHAMLREQCNQAMPPLDAHTDPVTGLSSQTGLTEILETMQAIKLRQKDGFSMLLITLADDSADNGQADATDPAALQSIAAMLVSELRSTDLVTRYGSNGFAVVLPRTGAEGADVVARRIEQMVERSIVVGDYRCDFRLIAVTACDGEAIDEFLVRADDALRAAGQAAALTAG